MKTLKLALIVSFIVVMFASVSIVSAAAMEGTAVGYWSVTHPTPGRQVTLTVTFDSSSTQTLYLYAIGVHGDWMESGRFYGPDLSDDPVPVAPGQPYSAKIILDIPVTASLGEHEYYIGVDGVKENGESFSWDSPTYTVTFDVSSAPTPTGQPNSGSTNPPTDGGLNNMLVYVAVIAVVAVVAIVLAIFIVKRSGKKPDAPAESFPPESTFVPPPASPKPEQKPKAEPMPDPEPEPAPELTEPEDTEPESKDFTI